MIGKRLFLVLAAGALLLLQFTDCMAALTPDQQSMKCCGSMRCSRASQSHDCCKKMVSEPSPNMLPAVHVLLNPPAVVLVTSLVSFEIDPVASLPSVAIEAPQHSPPELYTLHACLLI
jgi:hypothetical protein